MSNVFKRKVSDHVRISRSILALTQATAHVLAQVEQAERENLHTRVMELGVNLKRLAQQLYAHGAWVQLHGTVMERKEAFAEEQAKAARHE